MYLGKGVEGIINGKRFLAGNINFIKENNIKTNGYEEKTIGLLNDGKTVLYFANECNIIGVIAVADTIKESSKDAIRDLKKKNIKIYMVTGDNKIVAQTIGKELKIDEIISEVMPQDKENEVSKLQKMGKKVLFVGDGINDSPALTRADVGMAVASGTDIAIESADVVLMNNSLMDIIYGINLSEAVIKNIKMNLFWAFFYNSIGIPIATGIFYNSFGLKLNPMFGALAMSLSSVCVVTNALRLKNFKFDLKEGKIKMNQEKIFINGMQCNHCKMTVEKVLTTIPNVKKVVVNLEEKSAIVEYVDKIDNEKIKELINDAGFEVVEIK